MNKKYYLLTSNINWSDEHNVPAMAVMDQKEFNEWKKLSTEYICADLGNSGDGYEANFIGFIFREEFIDAGYVDVMEVDENFYKTFYNSPLTEMSLSNILKFP